MRRAIGCLVAIPLALAVLMPGARAQSGAPHAWLFGAWVGGLFPASGAVSIQACLGQPTVIFTRDVVLRAQLTEPSYVQRVIVTARNAGGRTEFEFTPSVDALAANSNGLLGLDPPKPAVGFGCESDDTLHVKRVSENEIVFPGCRDFPNPLIRCPGR